MLCSYDSEDTAAPLYFTEKAKDSRFFGSLPEKIVADLATKPYARESHSHGLSLASFDADKVLKEEYEVLSLSTDPEGEVRPQQASSVIPSSVCERGCSACHAAHARILLWLDGMQSKL